MAFGHSHLGTLAAAYSDAQARRGIDFELTTYQLLRSDRQHIVHIDGQGWHYHPEIAGDLSDLIDTLRPDAVVVMLQGEQAASAALLAPVRPFDFFFPDEADHVPAPDAGIIPFNLMLAATRAIYTLPGELIDQLRSKLPTVTVALSPPPIIGDQDYILSNDIRHAGISEHIEQYGLPPTPWRVRVWKLHTTALRRLYAERGIAFIDPPPAAVDDEGCLKADLRVDVFHANATYGAMLLRQIGDLFPPS